MRDSLLANGPLFGSDSKKDYKKALGAFRTHFYTSFFCVLIYN